MAKKIIFYDDAWIVEHYGLYSTYQDFCDAYNKAHDSNIIMGTFRSHCNKQLGLHEKGRGYSAEQKQWIIENYPNLGSTRTVKAFNDKFKTKKSFDNIHKYTRYLGLKVTDETKAMIKAENPGRSLPEGSIRIKTNRKDKYIKKNGKWVKIKEQIKPCKEGEYVIHLDGDHNNCDPNNLMVVDRKTHGFMMNYHFWSGNPELVKTAILWCKLKQLNDN